MVEMQTLRLQEMAGEQMLLVMQTELEKRVHKEKEDSKYKIMIPNLIGK